MAQVCVSLTDQYVPEEFVDPHISYVKELVLANPFRTLNALELFMHPINIDYLRGIVEDEAVCCQKTTMEIFDDLIDGHRFNSDAGFKSHRKLENLHHLNDNFLKTFANRSLQAREIRGPSVDRDPNAYGITAESFKGGYYDPVDYIYNNPFNKGPAWKPIKFNIRTARNFEYKKSTFAKNGKFDYRNSHRTQRELTEEGLNNQLHQRSWGQRGYTKPKKGNKHNYDDAQMLMTEQFSAGPSYDGEVNDIKRYEDPGGVPFWRWAPFRRHYDYRAANDGLVSRGQGDFGVNDNRIRYHNEYIYKNSVGKPHIPLNMIPPPGSI